MTHTDRIEIALDIYERRWHRLARFLAMGVSEVVIARERRLAALASKRLAAVVNVDDAPLVKIGQGSFEQVYPPRRLP